jgi:hypothetical protein
MERWEQVRRVPLVLVLCTLLLGIWGLRPPSPQGVMCDRISPGQVICQATLPRPWVWLPPVPFTPRPFALQDIALSSTLCDNSPRGGVRFCHRLTLLGTGRPVTLPEVRTPLSAAALSDQLQRFMAGEGAPQLHWSSPAPEVPWRTLAIALLLAVATWALWDVRWPPTQPSPLAQDGAEERGPGERSRRTNDPPD